MSGHNCSVCGWNSTCLQSVYRYPGPKYFTKFHIKALLLFAIKGSYLQGGHVEGANCVQLTPKKPQSKGSKWNHSNELWADLLILMLRVGQKCLCATSSCDCVRAWCDFLHKRCHHQSLCYPTTWKMNSYRLQGTLPSAASSATDRSGQEYFPECDSDRKAEHLS